MSKVTIIEPTLRGPGHRGEDGYGSEGEAQPKLRVAAYARVSTEQDEQQSSYEAQVDYYTNYIRNNPQWEFVGIYADEGITGTNTRKREGFNSMVQTAMNGEIDLILTKSISRFARNTVDTLKTVRELKAKGVEVIFEKESIHTFDPKCEVMLTIMSSLAQEESRSISENVRWGKQKSMQDGKVSMSYSHFLGYRKGEDGRPEIVPEEAKIVQDIYQMFLSGMSIRKIAASLTEHGIPTPGGKTNWPVSTVRSILSNDKYKGDALLQKTYTVDYLTKEKRKNKGERRQYLVENSHDAIIDAETFGKVQVMLKDTTPMGKIRRSRHPFAYKLICADCGSYYVHKIYHRSYGNVDVWRCSHRSDGDKCQTPILREEQIKEAFLQELAKIGIPETEFNGDRFKELVDHVTVYPDGEMEFCFRDEPETANASYQMEAALASHA